MVGFCGLQCLATEWMREQARSKEIDAAAAKDVAAHSEIKKLLLLGAGESGKSTLFKQMIKLYGPGYSEEERRKFDHIIYANVISAIQTLIRNTERLKVKYPHLDTQIKVQNRDHAHAVMALKADSVLTPEDAAHIKVLWNDPGIRCTFVNRSKFQLTDNSNWFFDKIDEICAPSYVPSEADILRSRVRTTGIVETEFELENSKFQMFDVGGQRNERKKWIHCFDSVTAVIFVAALSDYDQVLYEDGTTNRMHEALTLFGDIVNSEWFKSTPVILFLNKSDLFAEKIKLVHINVCFPQYFGSQEFEPCAQYVKQAFEARNLIANKPVYTHITCATDSENIRHVFTAVKDIVIRRSLSDIGLL
ncbi:unnamed protein product (mitochondrion) [Plasmodiophora brassicae]|uniref:Uncharacterized protein n=1 Tax=Plasmodiophora brassicae TaxID=37360 RepID=A0A0G4IYI4_PLABS|nr:hypothetical protein PBRA_007888 [Plasmodiophora brassicae]SPQ98961.1 unnamed protein product [Plasmodiophora brassicae]